MTRVEKAIQYEEEQKQKIKVKKRNDLIFKSISVILFLTMIVGLIIYGYLNYKQVDSSKSVSEQIEKIVETPNDKKSW